MDKRNIAIIVMAIIIGVLVGRYVFTPSKSPDVVYIKPGTPVVNVTVVDTTIAGTLNPDPVYSAPAEEKVEGMDDSVRVYEETYTDSLGSSVTTRDSVRGVLLRQWVNMKLKSTTITRVDTAYLPSDGANGSDKFKFYITGGLSSPGQFATKDGVIVGAPASITVGGVVTHKNSVFFYNYDPIYRRHNAGAGFKVRLKK
jgi:hypothetical protein